MKRRETEGWVLTLVVCCMVPAAQAADPEKLAPAQQARPVSATASPASQDLSVTGTIAKLEFPVPEPNLTLIDKNETKWLMMMFKPLSIPIWQNNLRSRIEELRVGQQVKIVYTEQPDREKRVSSIEILTPTATTTPVTSSSTPSARIP